MSRALGADAARARGLGVRVGAPADIAAWHRARWLENADNGANGRYFSPRMNGPEPPRPQRESEDRDLARLCLSPREPGWLRLWLASDARGELVGHATLQGAAHAWGLHRATLGLGLVAAYRGLGGGSALLGAALAWARATPELAWVDLSVFCTNSPAERLYRRAGFVETGRVTDELRVDGVSIDQLHMALEVRGLR